MRCGNCGNELRGDARFCSKCGAPVPPAQPSYSAPPPPAATFGDTPRAPLSGAGQPRKGSGCGKVLLILFIIGLIIAVGLAIGGYYLYRFAEDKLKSSEAYTLAIDTLKADPEAADKLGAIKETGFPLGNFSENSDGTGSALFRVSVTGEKASGNYDVVMTRSERRWRVRSGKLTLNGGEVIDIVTPGEPPETPAPFEVPQPPAQAPARPGRAISGGVLNGKAISKPQPAYPAVARAARASGTVVVSVEVDEKGNVTSAKAISGHPLLRAAAEAAARQARFSPTLLSGKPVKVTGTITYNFELPEQE
jgi:TonB family protein